jgi:uncharacterized protein YggE
METKTILFAILAIALIALTGCVVQVPQGQTNENTINVQGSSELTFKPDKAEVWVGISIVNSTAAEAQNEANTVINKIIDGLRYKGFNESNIQTDQLSLYEEREWKDGESKVVGWRATQTLKIKTTDLTKVGTIVDVAVNNGANQIQSIQFGLSDAKEKEYKKQALTDATTNAKEKAETIAGSLGVKLGAVKTVSESNYYYAPWAYSMKNMAAGADAISEASTVLPSDVTVSASISIVYLVAK